jgi:hypothetical protein
MGGKARSALCCVVLHAQYRAEDSAGDDGREGELCGVCACPAHPPADDTDGQGSEGPGETPRCGLSMCSSHFRY